MLYLTRHHRFSTPSELFSIILSLLLKQDLTLYVLGLAIDGQVNKGYVDPGRYFVLRLDFSAVIRSPDRKEAIHNLNLMVDETIKRFYRAYEPYLRMSAYHLIDIFIEDCAMCVMADEYDSYSNDYLVSNVSIHWKPLREADPDSLLNGFWTSVDSGLGNRRIKKCYNADVSPQSLADKAYGSNMAQNVSWEPELASFCDLTEADAAAALALKRVYKSTAEAEKCLKIMRNRYNGFFNFVPGGQGPLTYNTNTFLEYLQRLATGKPMKKPLSVTNSEISEAASPVVMRLLEDDIISEMMGLSEMRRRGCRTWCILGGLMFCIGKKALRISNLVVAERFERAILDRYHASLEDVDGVFRILVKDGYIDGIFDLYTRCIQEHCVGANGFKKKEHRCNSMRFTLLANLHPSLQKVGVETTLAKVKLTRWCVFRRKKQLFVLEWACIQIDHIKVGSGTRSVRANALTRIPAANLLLDLKFRNHEYRAGQTIKDRILIGPKNLDGNTLDTSLDSPSSDITA
ncbi:hypothetical protein EDD11_002990 [Mortierella claussenii]|nr:hypothetical protein EDD11_002990 [Mortierella claussenii]